MVMAAICGGKVKDPTEKCPVTAVCSMLLKCLVPSYTNDFVWALSALLDRKLLSFSVDDVVPARRSIQQAHSCVWIRGSAAWCPIAIPAVFLARDPVLWF